MYEVFGGYALTQKGLMRDISLAVEGNHIVDIGKTADLRKKYKFAKSIGGKSMVISPSFVDAHMHSAQVATKGQTIGKSLLEWLKKYIWKWEGSMTREQAKACASLTYLEMIKSGTTAFVDYTSVRHTDQAFKVAKEFGLRATIGKTLMDRNSPSNLQESTEDSVKDTERLIRKYHNSEGGRLRYSITPRFGITCSDELLIACKKLSKKFKVMITTHANESPGELKSDKKNYGTSSVSFSCFFFLPRFFSSLSALTICFSIAFLPFCIPVRILFIRFSRFLEA